ncbi:MAG: hypothetical protein KAR85_00510 [Methanosarcinales archaeon]|nr:hypothetical protein [Methanosarcinales archaeon]
MGVIFKINTHNKLPFIFSKIGRWWRKGHEIEIIATDEYSKNILFGECKWQNRKTCIDVLTTLIDKSRFVDWNINYRKWGIHFIELNFLL